MLINRDEMPLVRAGIPSDNRNFYHRIRFLAGDPGAIIDWPVEDGKRKSTLIIRNIEVDRARQHARADEVYSPQHFVAPTDLLPDHELAAAQGLAACLKKHGARAAIADRSMPLIFADLLKQNGIQVFCDPALGVMERRAKDAQEIEYLRQAQADTEKAIEYVCRLIARAPANRDGVLQHDGAALTSERVRAMTDIFLLNLGYTNPDSIIAAGPIASDCHHHGTGEIRTGQPVIVDIFPTSKKTLYAGDCTRTVVHGDIPDAVKKMHADVAAAKRAATAVVKAGASGHEVHQATKETLQSLGNHIGFSDLAKPGQSFIPHGTGHGVGLSVHEPPLLTDHGDILIPGDALTIEPALYNLAIGGVRIEDMVIVTETGCDNLNQLPEGLVWK